MTTLKPGVRALGVAESAGDERATLAGAVVRADRVVDGAGFDACTVGGLDATARVRTLVSSLERPDLQYLFVGAVAPAWYNLIDIGHLHEATDLPVLAVTFEDSEGLEPAIREAFSGDGCERRLAIYRSLPARRAVSVNDETVYVRALGLSPERTDRVVRGFTPVGGRPEPLRVARILARAARSGSS